MSDNFFQTDLSWLEGAFAEEVQATSADGKKGSTAKKVKKSGKTLEWAGEVLTISMGAVRRAGFKLTEEHKRKISEGNKGVSRQTAWLGRTHSEETKEKIRQFNLNRVPHVFTEEEKAEIGRKISEAKKGKKRDAATVAKVAQANRGRKQSAEEKEKRAVSMRGRKRSPEVAAKVAAAVSAKVSKPVMTPYGLFKSRLEAIKALVLHGHSESSFYRLLESRPNEFFYVKKEK